MLKNNKLVIIKIIICFLLITSCYSQNFNTGAIVGINTSQVSGDNLSGFNQFGLRIGGFINKKLKNFNGQIDLQYIQKGSRSLIDQDTFQEGYKFQLNYIEIPISIQQGIQKKTEIELGVAVSYLLGWSETYNTADDYGIDVKNIEYSLHFGIIYNISENLYFNSRISNSISPIRPHTSGQTYQWNKGQYNTSISFGLLYYLFKK